MEIKHNTQKKTKMTNFGDVTRENIHEYNPLGIKF